MEKLRDKKKHDHLLTKLLKAVIFSIVMLAPFFAILSKIMYVSFNKNAYESYYAETINEEKFIYLNQSSTIKHDLYYYVNANELSFTSGGNIYISNFEIYDRVNMSDNSYNSYISHISEVYRLYFSSDNVIDVYYFDSQGGHYLTDIKASKGGIFRFYINSYDNNANLKFNNFYYIEYNNYSFLDNSFYYAVNQLDEMPLFNWTKNTGLYTTLNAMCSGLDVGTNILAILLTYWALMTAIYIVFDIIIELFTKLTHILA